MLHHHHLLVDLVRERTTFVYVLSAAEVGAAIKAEAEAEAGAIWTPQCGSDLSGKLAVRAMRQSANGSMNLALALALKWLNGAFVDL